MPSPINIYILLCGKFVCMCGIYVLYTYVPVRRPQEGGVICASLHLILLIRGLSLNLGLTIVGGAVGQRGLETRCLHTPSTRMQVHVAMPGF